jgi:hypothetical protein
MSSDDIVTRLRITHHSDCKCVGCEAAGEIERLRAEIAIPRDEYAKTWQCVLDRIEVMDIASWLREYAKANDPSDFKSPIAASVISRTDAKYIEAAGEIERLRKERDEARREICRDESYNHKSGVTPCEVAEDRGWDCFNGGSDATA